MKAIRIHTFGEPEVMQLEEVPDPQPGPGQVVVRVHAVGVNPVETYIRSGIYPKPPTPYTPGNDGAGVVEAVGPEVSQISVGARVYITGAISGTYAEKALCQAARVHPLPTQATYAQGAAINVPYGTAYHALIQRARALPGRPREPRPPSRSVNASRPIDACNAGIDPNTMAATAVMPSV